MNGGSSVDRFARRRSLIRNFMVYLKLKQEVLLGFHAFAEAEKTGI